MYINKFTTCVFTNGATESLIIDIERNKIYKVDKSIVEILEKIDNVKIEKLINEFNLYNIKKKQAIDLINSLIENEILFNSICKINLIKLNLNFNYYEQSNISNMIVDIDLNKNKIENYIQCFKTTHLQLRILNNINVEYNEIKLFLKSYLHESVSIVIPYENFKKIKIKLLNLSKNGKIQFILIYNSLTNMNKNNLIFTTQNDLSSLNCGVIDSSYFTKNLSHFTESRHHNTCLNRKISIDANGEIKNCPSMAKSYGNIKDTKLIDVVNNPEFQKVWHIKKDEITKCKDCEFRHICTDCRAYIENPEDQYSAPLKCGYDPYTCEWEEWSTNPLKQKAIAFYGMQNLIKS
jgi:SPASM domain peptide maturase of grasp-with-spasm system